MLRAGYGPLRVTGDATCVGAGDGDHTPRFTDDGLGRGVSATIAWADVSGIQIAFSAVRALRLLEIAAELLNFGVAPGPSLMPTHSTLVVSLTSGERVSWSFDLPSRRSTGRWSRKNTRMLFEELSALGTLPLLGDPAAAGQLLAELYAVRPLAPWRRRRRIAGIVMGIGERRTGRPGPGRGGLPA